MRPSRHAPAVVAALLLAASTAPAVMYHQDTGNQKSQDLADLPPFASRANATGGCSAVLIAPNVVLSAAHCTNYAASGTTTVSWNGQTRSGAPYTRIGADHLIIVTDSPFTGTTGKMTAPYAGSSESGRLVWKVGSGGHGVLGAGSSGPFYDGRFRAMTNRIEVDNVSNPPTNPSGDWLFYDFDAAPANASRPTTLYEGGTAPGDSGGPLYMHENGRWYVIGVTSGPDAGFYRDGRVRTDIGQIESLTGHSWARPTAPALEMRWVAQDLVAGSPDGAAVTTWPRQGGSEAWADAAAAGGSGITTLVHGATPAGTAAIDFPGTARLGLAGAANSIGGETAFTLAMVVKADAAGAGEPGQWFDNTGLIDAEQPGQTADWGLAIANHGRPGLGVGNPDTTAYSGTAIDDGQWHVVVATWDGAEVSGDASGYDRNLAVYVDHALNPARAQGPEFLNVARNGDVNLTLGGSRSAARFFDGRIAEVRCYRGALEPEAVAALITELQSIHLTSSPALPQLALSRPAGGRAAVTPEQGIVLDGTATAPLAITQTAGPGGAVITPGNAFPSRITFPSPGHYRFQVTAGGGASATSEMVDIAVAADPASATLPEQPITPVWTATNIGGANTSGGLSLGTTTSLTGAGMGMEEMSDSLRFVHHPLTGDGVLTARVASFTADNGGKAYGGIMLRSSLRRESPMAAALVVSGGGTRFTRRTEPASYVETTSHSSSAPQWLRLVRSGSQITCFRSDDGLTWTALGPAVTLAAAPSTLYAGLFVASFNNNGNSVIRLTDLALARGGSLPVAPQLSIPGRQPAVSNNFTLAATSDRPATFAWEALAAPAAPVFSDPALLTPQFAFVPGPHRLRLTADDGNTTTFLEQDLDPGLDARWDFAANDDAQGWVRGGGTGTVGVTGGVLSAPVTAADPWIQKNNACFVSGDAATSVVVRYRGSATGTAQLFWGRSGANSFTGSRVLNANYTVANTWQYLVFTPGSHADWTGRVITSLRFDPPGGAGSSFEVDAIAFGDGTDRNGDGTPDALESLRYWNASPLDGGWTDPLAWNTGPLGTGSTASWSAGDDVRFDRPDTYSVTLAAPASPGSVEVLAGNVTLTGAGVISQSTISIVAGASLVSASDSSLSGSSLAFLNQGTLRIGNGGGEGRAVGPILNAGTLRVNRSGTLTLAHPISGGGSLVVESPRDVSTLELRAENAFTGSLTITSGSVLLDRSDAIGSGTKTIFMTNGTAGNPRLLLDGSTAPVHLPAGVSLRTSNNHASGAIRSEAGENRIDGDILLTAGGGDTRVFVVSGSLTLGGAIAPNTTNRGLILDGPGNGRLEGPLGDGAGQPLRLEKPATSTGTWISAASHTHSGATTVRGGTFLNHGSMVSPLSVHGPGVAGGSGSFGAVTLLAGATLAPGGDAAGTVTTGTLAMGNDSRLAIDIADWDGTPGSGHDQVQAAAITITATPASPWRILLSVAPGLVASAESRAFAIATGPVTGFSPAAVVVDASAWSGPPGDWSVAQVGDALELRFTPDPYGAWIAGFAPLADATRAGDPDGDGIPNLTEFALDDDPSQPVRSPRVAAVMMDHAGQRHLTLTLPVRGEAVFSPEGDALLSSVVDGLRYRIEGSRDLVYPLPLVEVVPALAAALPPPRPGWTYRSFRLAPSLSTEPRGFLRIRILPAE
jgi:hypothetical protein